MEDAKSQLEVIVKPFQQEQKKQQKKGEFVEKCIRCIEKDDFFQLDELLKSKQASEIVEDPQFSECKSIFSSLSVQTDRRIDQYRLTFNAGLLELAEKMNLPMTIDWPRFSVVKGVEGELDFSKRTTTINQTTLKSIDPKKIVAKALDLKKKLYGSIFEPQKFINALLESYQTVLKKTGQKMGDTVPISELYVDYVWSLQNKTFFLNMDKVKFKGYSIEQFAVDLWRFFESGSSAEGEYRIKLTPGRNKMFWLIDQDGERRHITGALFMKN